jgi:type IV secretory pathway TrbF-like protein
MLFNRKRPPDESQPGKGREETLQTHPNTPASVYDLGAQKFAEIYGSSMVGSNRFFLVAILALLLALVCSMATLVVFPLKEIRPWVVEVNPVNGMVNKPVEIQKISPSQAVIKAELARWAEAVYSIDQIRTPDLYKYANMRTRDKAIAQFTEFRIREKTFERLSRENGLSREVKVTAVDASQSGIAFVFLTTVERGGATGGDVTTKRFRLTLHYQLDPAKLEDDLLTNPLGLYVIFFNEAEERVN